MVRPNQVHFGVACWLALVQIPCCIAKADPPVLTLEELIEKNSKAFENLKFCEIEIKTQSNRIINGKAGNIHERDPVHWRHCPGIDRVTTKSLTGNFINCDKYADGKIKKYLLSYKLADPPTLKYRSGATAWIGSAFEMAGSWYHDKDPNKELPFSLPFYTDNPRCTTLKEQQANLRITRTPNKEAFNFYELNGIINEDDVTVLVDPLINFQLRKATFKSLSDDGLTEITYECLNHKDCGNGIFFPEKLIMNATCFVVERNEKHTIRVEKTFNIRSINTPIDKKELELQFPEWVEGWDDDKKIFFIWGKTEPFATFKNKDELTKWTVKQWFSGKSKEAEGSKEK